MMMCYRLSALDKDDMIQGTKWEKFIEDQWVFGQYRNLLLPWEHGQVWILRKCFKLNKKKEPTFI